MLLDICVVLALVSISSSVEGYCVTMEELSSDELKMIATAFKEMNVKPNLESTTEFKDWMMQYAASKIKQEQGDTTSASTTSTTSTTTTTSASNTTTTTTSASNTTTTTTVSSNYIPKISTFSGDSSKQDTAYDQWKYEVECLIREQYKESSVAQAIRRSLKGDASSVAMRLGPEAKISEIMEKMESVFGTVERGETTMEEFYSANQKKSEDSMAWSCRLEEIYRKAIEKGVARKEDANEKLRSRYWNGLHQWLKDITGYKFDKMNDFDELRREIRLIEKEHEKKSTPIMAIGAEKESEKSEMQELKGMLQQLTAKVNKLEGQQQHKDNGKQEQGASSNYNEQQHTRQYNRGGNTGGRGGNRGYGRQNYDRGYYKPPPYQDRHHGYDRPQQYYEEEYYDDTQDRGPICYRCGQEGHLARGCKVILDHSRRGLNSRRPASRGRW